MRKQIVMVLVIFLLSGLALPGVLAAEGDYVDNLAHAYTRGAKNVLTGVVELPLGIREYAGQGIPGINYLQGFFYGTFRMAARTGSGAWDLVGGLIPGFQQGFPMDPETLI